MSQEQLTFSGPALRSGAPLQNVRASGCRIAFVFRKLQGFCIFLRKNTHSRLWYSSVVGASA